jgi:flavin-dependent dehydrogenase
MGGPVVVVGAGPAGATAAMRLHRAGLPVVLLDRAHFPRDKICGDLLPPRTFPLLRQAGFQPSWDPQLQRSALLARGSVVFDRLARQRPQAWRSTESGRLSLTPIAEALPRRLFDALLVDQLRQHDLPVREGWQLTQLRPDTGGGWCLSGRRPDPSGACRGWELQASWVLAADGAGSRVRQQMLGSHHRDDLAVGVRVMAEPANGSQPSELIYPQPHSLLYRWSFQLGEQRNLGLFRPLATADAAAPPAAHLARQWFGRSGVAWACPLLPPPERLVGSPAPGVLLLGDAASLIDPLLGHGIDHAAESGLLAANCVLHSASVAEGSLAYDSQLKALFVPRWQQLQALIRRQLS